MQSMKRNGKNAVNWNQKRPIFDFASLPILTTGRAYGGIKMESWKQKHWNQWRWLAVKLRAFSRPY